MMTTIGSVSAYSAYSAYRSTTSTGSGSSSASSASSTASGSGASASATTITLSATAQAALNGKSFADVVEETRSTLTDLLTAAGTNSPYKDGKLAIDLSGFDRRELFAIADNESGVFSSEEMRAATDEMTLRFDQAMAGPLAVYRVTGDISTLYEAALDHLEEASSEEQATTVWATKHDAVEQVLSELQGSSDRWPSVENDPVVAWLDRVESGTAGQERDFASVASDARAALDQQIATARAAGKDLVYSSFRKSGQQADLTGFSSRALSAIALNEGNAFSTEESNAASKEIAARGRQVLMSCISDANSSSDPTALAQNIIAAYGSLSAEERQAVGWGDSFYQTALANYQTASYFANFLGSSSTTGSSSGTGTMSLGSMFAG